MQQWQCTGKANEQWTLVSSQVPGYYTVRNENSGVCLDVTGGSTANGTQVQQWGCWNGPQQLWKPVPSFASGYFSLKNYKSGLCLDVAGSSTANGTKVQQWACWSTTGQQWKGSSLAAAYQQEEAAAKKREEEQAAAKKRQQEEAAAEKRQEEEAAARKHQEEEAAAKGRQEAEAVARARQEGEAAATTREEVPVPAPRPGQVRVKVTASNGAGREPARGWTGSRSGGCRRARASVSSTRPRRRGSSGPGEPQRVDRAPAEGADQVARGKRYRAGDRLSLDISRHGYTPERANFAIRDGRQPKLTHR